MKSTQTGVLLQPRVLLQAMGPLNYYFALVIGKKRSGPPDRD